MHHRDDDFPSVLFQQFVQFFDAVGGDHVGYFSGVERGSDLRI